MTSTSGKENTAKVPPTVGIKRKSRSWDESYKVLVQYQNRHGHANVPYPYPPDTALGSWVKNQRIYEEKLSDERRQLLLDIGFEFSRRASGEEHWKQTFNELKQYKTTCGCPPQTDPHQLGRWATNQRRRIREGSTKKEARQQMIGYVCQDTTEKDSCKYGALWQKQYNKLKDYQEEHGHCNIPLNHADSSLYQWVCRQRYLYNKDLIQADRKELLDGLGFDWDSGSGGPRQTRQQEWDEQYEKLVLFREANPDKKLKGASRALNGWMTSQKTRFRDGDMDPLRAEKLIGLGFQPPAESERSWNGRYQQLKGISSWEDLKKDLCLNRWVQLQRFLHQKGLLAKERSRRLDAIGFQWDGDKMPKRRSGNKKTVEETPRKRRGSVEMVAPSSRKKPRHRSSLTAADFEKLETPIKQFLSADMVVPSTQKRPRRRSSLTTEDFENLLETSSARKPRRRSTLTARDFEKLETPIKRSATYELESNRTRTKKRRSSLLSGGRLQL